MPRRRRNMFGMPNAAPPPPITIAQPVLNLGALQSAYEWAVVDKMVALKLALEWYTESIQPSDPRNPSPLLFGDPLNPDRQKTFDRAIKARSLGDSATLEGEKAQAWTTAIKLFEKVWAARNLPKVEDALNAIGGDPSQRVKDVLSVIENFNTAFGGLVKFRMTYNAEREFHDGEILIPEAEVNQLIGKPPLEAVLAEIQTVARVAAIAKDADGNAYVDNDKAVELLAVITTSVLAWAASKERLLKPLGKVPKAAKVRGPKAPGAPKAPRAAAGPRTVLRPGAVITALPGFNPRRFNGSRGARARCLVSGQTVQAFIQACGAAGFAAPKAKAFLQMAIQMGVITVN